MLRPKTAVGFPMPQKDYSEACGPKRFEEARKIKELLKEIVIWAQSVEQAPHAYLAAIFHKDRALPVDKAIWAIVMSWFPLWALFLVLAVSTQGQDLLNHLKSDVGDAFIFFAALAVLCIVATIVATTLLAAWHLPRIAQASSERRNLFGVQVPSLVSTLTHPEFTQITQTARLPVVLAIATPLALLTTPIVAGILALTLSLRIGTLDEILLVVAFILSIVFFRAVACATVSKAAHFALHTVAASYVMALAAFGLLTFIAYFPTRIAFRISTEVVVVIIAACWLFVFLGFSVLQAHTERSS